MPLPGSKLPVVVVASSLLQLGRETNFLVTWTRATDQGVLSIPANDDAEAPWSGPPWPPIVAIQGGNLGQKDPPL